MATDTATTVRRPDPCLGRDVFEVLTLPDRHVTLDNLAAAAGGS